MLLNEVRKAKRATWEDFVHKPDRNEIQAVTRYTELAVTDIAHHPTTADRHGDKAKMLSDVCLPAPAPYGDMRAEEDPQAIGCVDDWGPDRGEALIRADIRLAIRLAKWKTASGATIPKSGKDDYEPTGLSHY